jgi:hypothetical protein
MAGMNPAITIQPNQFAAWPFSGVNSLGALAAIHGTISSSDPTKGYLFRYPGGVDFVPTVPAPAGGSYTVTVTIQAFSADGTELFPVALDVTVNGTPLPPQAVAVYTPGPVAVSPGNTDFGIPTDPGTPTITF